jgi:hypothetical protein
MSKDGPSDSDNPRDKRMRELMDVKVELDEQSQTDAFAEAKRKDLKAQIENTKKNQLEITRSNLFRQNLQVEDDPLSENPLLRLFPVFYVLCCLGSLVSFWVAIMHGWGEFFTFENVLGFRMRPYVVMNLITTLATLFFVIAKANPTVSGLTTMMSHHGLFTPEERAKTERRIEFLSKLETFCRYLFCVLTFTFLISALGWEAAIAFFGGAKASIAISWLGGTAIWLFLPNYFKE